MLRTVHPLRAVIAACVTAAVLAGPATAGAAQLVSTQVVATDYAPGSVAGYRLAFAGQSAGREVRAIRVQWCASATCDGAPDGASLADAEVAAASVGTWNTRAATSGRITLVPDEPVDASDRLVLRLTRVRNPAERASATLRVTTYADSAATKPIDTVDMDLGIEQPTYVVDATNGSDRNAGSEDAPLRTLAGALQRASGGETIDVRAADDAQPAVWDNTERTSPVLVRGVGTKPPTLEGLVLRRSGLLTVSGVRVAPPATASYGVQVVGSGVADVTLSGLEVTYGSRTTGTCVGVGVGARRIHVRDAWLHDCMFGVRGLVSSEAMATPATAVTVAGNLIEELGEDGVQIAFWRSSSVRGNVIRDAARSGAHNDGIQVLGGVRTLTIERNRISGIADQGVLLGDAPLPLTTGEPTYPGPNVTVRIANNIVHDTGLDGGGFAFNVFSTRSLNLRHNTAWANRNGGLLIGPGVGAGVSGSVVGNILDGLVVRAGDVLLDQRANLLAWTREQAQAGASDVLCATCDPGFVDLAGRDLRVRAPSPARGITDDWSGTVDFDWFVRSSPATAGAYEALPPA